MWSEDALHRWLARRPRPGRLAGSAGHDAAVLRAAQGRTVACVDATVEGVHFDAGTPARQVGAKAAGRALSDLAASAAHPRALLLSIVAPSTSTEPSLRALVGAVARAGERHGAELVGGDLACAAGPLTLSVTALGELPGRRRPPGRDRARAGQRIVVTGALGGSRLGRHLRVEPRLAAGRWLHERGASAMMDISDGLAWDLFRLARASSVAIALEHVPVHADARRAARTSGEDPGWHALNDGEDYELVATLPAQALERVLAEAPGRCPGLVPIGRVQAGRGLVITSGEHAGRWRGDGGWRHGR